MLEIARMAVRNPAQDGNVWAANRKQKSKGITEEGVEQKLIQTQIKAKS